jgi:hypothetical protein
MHHIDYGLGGLSASVFDRYADRPVLDLAAVYRDLVDKDELLGIEMGRRFHEIGSPEGLAGLEEHLTAKAREKSHR